MATKLAKWTFENLKWKRVDYADAAKLWPRARLIVTSSANYTSPWRAASACRQWAVLGFAYSGGSFGGHASFEVYVGDWIEIDPTWGTSFVDATHIKKLNRGFAHLCGA